VTLSVLSISPSNGAQAVGEADEVIIVLRGSIPLTGLRISINGQLAFAKGRDPDSLTQIRDDGAIYPGFVGYMVPKALSDVVTVRVRSRQNQLYSGKITVTGSATTSTNLVTNDRVDFSTTYYVRSEPLTNVRQDVRDTPISHPLPQDFVVSAAFQGAVRSLICTPESTSFYLCLLNSLLTSELRSTAYFLDIDERDERDSGRLRDSDTPSIDVSKTEALLSSISPLWDSFMSELEGLGVNKEVRELLTRAWDSGSTLSRLAAASGGLLFVNQSMR